MEEHHLIVPRSARYYTLGDPSTVRQLWIVLHGYGQLGRFFLRPFTGFEQGRAIIAPEGLSRFYTDTAHSRAGATWMTCEDRETEIIDHVVYLDRLADHLIGKNGSAPAINVLGFSQGVATACRWSLLGKTAMQRIVLWGGTMPPEFEADQLAKGWRNTAVDLVHGKQDTVVDASVLLRNQARLREAGVAQRTIHHPGGHVLDGATLKRVLAA